MANLLPMKVQPHFTIPALLVTLVMGAHTAIARSPHARQPSPKPPEPQIEWHIKLLPQADIENEKKWLAYETTTLAEFSDVIGGRQVQQYVEQHLGHPTRARAYVLHTVPLHNTFGARFDGTAIYIVAANFGKVFVQDFVIDEDGISDQKLKAKITDRQCLKEEATNHLYTHLVLSLMSGMKEFKDRDVMERARTSGVPLPLCVFEIRGVLYKGSNFYGIRKVWEVGNLAAN